MVQDPQLDMFEHRFGLTTPCDNCPFRSDLPGYLTKGRVREIQKALERSEFYCHKSVKYGDGTEYINSGEEINCAGAMILLEKLGRPSQMMRIAERLGLYDKDKLNMAAPIFNSFEEMLQAQESLKPILFLLNIQPIVL